MEKPMYDLVAYIARYGFCAFALVILWRAVHWIRYEASVKATLKNMLPDAGYIGEWAVLHGDGKMKDGTILSAPRDGFLGSGRSCDVCIPVKGVRKRAARFYFRPDGLHLLPANEGEIIVDGRPVRKEAVLRHGAILSMEGVVLQFRLFAGILLVGEATVEDSMQDAVDDSVPYEDYEDLEGFESFGVLEAKKAIVLPTPALRIAMRSRRGSGSRRGSRRLNV